jgi:hypothetical protein
MPDLFKSPQMKRKRPTLARASVLATAYYASLLWFSIKEPLWREVLAISIIVAVSLPSMGAYLKFRETYLHPARETAMRIASTLSLHWLVLSLVMLFVAVVTPCFVTIGRADAIFSAELTAFLVPVSLAGSRFRSGLEDPT